MAAHDAARRLGARCCTWCAHEPPPDSLPGPNQNPPRQRTRAGNPLPLRQASIE